MSRLDQHVGLVRFKLTLGTLAKALALSLATWLGVVLLALVVERLVAFHLPRHMIWFWSSGAVAIAAAVAYTWLRLPSSRQAAVAIDERLGLMEKFSTALYVRPSNDPFAAAAVRDAEKTASSVKLQKRFPVPYPKAANAMFLLALVALVTYKWLPQMNLLASETPQTPKFESHVPSRHAAEQLARQAIAAAEAAPREVAEDEHVKMAVGEMQKAINDRTADPVQTEKKAQDLLKNLTALKEKVAETQKFVTDNEAMKALEDVPPPSPDETGAIADAQRDLANKDVDKAIEDLKKAVDNLPKMDKKEQEKTAEQMQKLANQIQQKANDPKTQEQVKKDLEKAGVDKKTAEEMTKQMQAAANGDQQAQQKLQQMANQAIQQNNQQAGLSQQQQQAIANAVKQATQAGQQKMNNQAGAQQMAQTTQKLAAAMKQAAGGQQQQQANGQQAGQKSGQQAGQKGQGGQQAQAKGGQQGQNQGGQSQAQQQTAQQAMQQAMGQLSAMAKDQQAVGAAQQQAQMAQGGQGQGQQGQGNQQVAGQWGQGQGQGQGQQQGQPQQGQQGQGNGQGAVGVGGLRPAPEVAPFATKTEFAPSQTIEDGKIIAKSFVKAPSERGESKVQMSKAIDSESKADAGEVEPDRIPRSAQKAVKDYFDTLKQ